MNVMKSELFIESVEIKGGSDDYEGILGKRKQ